MGKREWEIKTICKCCTPRTHFFVATMSSAIMSQAVTQTASFKKFNPLRSVSASRPATKAVRVATTCSAEQDNGKKVMAAVLATAVAASSLTMDVQPAYADIAGLTPCSKSKAFAKREKAALKTLDKRLKQYEEGSAPALALNATKQRTQERFKKYGSYGLLCGTDGFPHLIVDGDLNHLGEFVTPGIAFLYIAGWIGYAGRSYIREIKKEKAPTEKEIIIDVPLALGFMFAAGGWPLRALEELRNGDLIEKEENITVSPR